MDLSVIIVNYNTKKLTLECLQSVFESKTSYAYEVYLVDNASSDGTAEAVLQYFPQVNVIQNRGNVGFSKANNQAISVSTGRYVLLLNSDTIVETRSLDTMIAFMDQNEEVGMSGCKLILPDGTLDDACKRGFPTPQASFYYAFGFSNRHPQDPKYNQYKLTHLDPDKMHEVDCLVGAFMMVRRKVIEGIGMLDEEFFMYGEDIDWCYRAKQQGWKIMYYPKTTVIHYKGASSRRKPVKIVYEFHRAMVLFHRKHYKKLYPAWLNLLVYAGISLKLFIALIKNGMKV